MHAGTPIPRVRRPATLLAVEEATFYPSRSAIAARGCAPVSKYILRDPCQSKTDHRQQQWSAPHSTEYLFRRTWCRCAEDHPKRHRRQTRCQADSPATARTSQRGPGRGIPTPQHSPAPPPAPPCALQGAATAVHARCRLIQRVMKLNQDQSHSNAARPLPRRATVGANVVGRDPRYRQSADQAPGSARQRSAARAAVNGSPPPDASLNHLSRSSLSQSTDTTPCALRPTRANACKRVHLSRRTVRSGMTNGT